MKIQKTEIMKQNSLLHVGTHKTGLHKSTFTKQLKNDNPCYCNRPTLSLENMNTAPLQKLISETEMAAVVALVKQKERKEIGQELHDNVNQVLSMVRLFAEMLKPADEQDEEIKKKILDYVSMAIDEIRKTSWDLVMAKQEDKGLVENVQQIVDNVHFSTPIKIIFKYGRNIECIAADKKNSLLRIVQEQIKNVIDYSKATLVNINLHIRKGNAVLLIKDNGIGFDTRQNHQGIGHYNIYERARSHNGVAHIQTKEGKGCMLTVSLPA
jgi:two-component system sensor histidine kinase UhpB